MYPSLISTFGRGLSVCALTIGGAAGVALAQLPPLFQGPAQSALTAAYPSEHVRVRPKLRAALRKFPDVEPLVVGERGTPFLLKGQFCTIAQDGDHATVADITRVAKDVLETLDLEPCNLVCQGTELDDKGYRHFYFRLRLKDRPVVGASLVMHVNPDGVLYLVHGTIPDEDGPIADSVSLTAAAARERVRERAGVAALHSAKERLVYVLPSRKSRMRLAWEVRHEQPALGGLVTTVSYIDAASGELVAGHEPVFHVWGCEVRNNVSAEIMYDEETGVFVWPETVARGTRPGQPTAVSSARAVNDAYNNCSRAYNKFSSFGYSGHDNADGWTTSIVNSKFRLRTPPTFTITGKHSMYAKVDFGDGLGMRPCLYFGTGPILTQNLAQNYANAPDVFGHEYAHAMFDARKMLNPITLLMEPCPLTGENQAVLSENMAINEGLADIFGTMVQRYAVNQSGDSWNSDTWLIGETTGSVIRNMGQPDVAAGQLDYYPDFVDGLHTGHQGATILGLAYKLLCVGGSHPRWSTGKPNVVVPPLGVAKAEKVFFRAFRYFLETGVDFVAAKHLIAEAAMAEFGNTLEAEFVRNRVYFAFDAVGVPYDESSLRAINISTRGWVGTGDQVMIAGFRVAGGTPKPLLIRGVGPTLGTFGVPSVLPDPVLTLRLAANGALVTSNDNWWQSPDAAAIASTADALYAFPLASGSYDAAMLPTLATETYTATVHGNANGTGVALVEVYDSDPPIRLLDPPTNQQRLVNLSTRANVTADPATGSVIAGFVVSGSGGKRLLIRAVGPTLAGFGVPGTVANPTIRLYTRVSLTGPDSQVYYNADWGQAWNVADIASATQSVWAFPLAVGSHDAAMLVDLPPGAYTAVVQSGSGSGDQGIVLVEVYEVPQD